MEGFVKGNYTTYLSILTLLLNICILPSSSESWDKGPDPVEKLYSYMIFFSSNTWKKERKTCESQSSINFWKNNDHYEDILFKKEDHVFMFWQVEQREYILQRSDTPLENFPEWDP